MGENFRESFKKMLDVDMNSASLFALSSAVLRHIYPNEREWYGIIRDILSTCPGKGPEIDKIKQIYVKVEEHDKQMIESLEDIEAVISRKLRGEKATCCPTPDSSIEKQKNSIKKWWKS